MAGASSPRYRSVVIPIAVPATAPCPSMSRRQEVVVLNGDVGPWRPVEIVIAVVVGDSLDSARKPAAGSDVAVSTKLERGRDGCPSGRCHATPRPKGGRGGMP